MVKEWIGRMQNSDSTITLTNDQIKDIKKVIRRYALSLINKLNDQKAIEVPMQQIYNAAQNGLLESREAWLQIESIISEKH